MRIIPHICKLSAVAACVLAVSGCGIVPKDGPTSTEIRGNAEQSTAQAPSARLGYALVAVTPPVLETANRLTKASNAAFGGFVNRGASAQARIAVGDVLALTVFEASSGGLFLPLDAGSRSGNFVQIPNQQVDSAGTITIPYSGAMKVAGRTPQDVGRDIAGRLAKRAIEPQVVVTTVERHGNDISVLGDVNLPLRFSMDPGGVKLLGAVARAGGAKNPPYETIVTVQRGRTMERALLSGLVRNPAQNIELQPGDVVYLVREPKIFMTLGATPSPGSVGGINNRRFTFDNDTMSLAEAIAKGGGLDDNRADPTAVFLYRLQSKRALQEQGVDVRSFTGDVVPTIYTVDLSRSDGLFLANTFQVRDRDMVYVSNAAVTDLNKFFGLVRNVTAPAYDASSAAALTR